MYSINQFTSKCICKARDSDEDHSRDESCLPAVH